MGFFCSQSRRETPPSEEIRCPSLVGVEVALKTLRRYEIGGEKFDVYKVSVIFMELGVLAEKTNKFGELLNQLLEKYNACCACPKLANVVGCARRDFFRKFSYKIYQLRSEEISHCTAKALRAKGFVNKIYIPEFHSVVRSRPKYLEVQRKAMLTKYAKEDGSLTEELGKIFQTRQEFEAFVSSSISSRLLACQSHTTLAGSDTSRSTMARNKRANSTIARWPVNATGTGELS